MSMTYPEDDEMRDPASAMERGKRIREERKARRWA